MPVLRVRYMFQNLVLCIYKQNIFSTVYYAAI